MVIAIVHCHCGAKLELECGLVTKKLIWFTNCGKEYITKNLENAFLISCDCGGEDLKYKYKYDNREYVMVGEGTLTCGCGCQYYFKIMLEYGCRVLEVNRTKNCTNYKESKIDQTKVWG